VNKEALDWLGEVVPVFREAPAANYPLAAIGGWSHANTTVREVAAEPEFWEYADLPRAELEARIAAADGIEPAHALYGCTFLSGEVLLVDGCHRWAAAAALGFTIAPVEMAFELVKTDD
jgi:hypothetical protein